MTKSCKRLQNREINIDDVLTFLILTYSTPNSRDGNHTVTTVLESAKSLDEIFRALSKYRLWDYINYYLLQSIIEEFASEDDELKNMMEQYLKDLTGHILTLRIQTYLDASHYERSINTSSSDSENLTDEIVPAPPPCELFKKLSIKVKANVTDHSLNYVNELWQSLAIQFTLPQPAMILHSIAKGCVGITWLIPANLVNHVTRMAQKTINTFAEQQIQRVIIHF